MTKNTKIVISVLAAIIIAAGVLAVILINLKKTYDANHWVPIEQIDYLNDVVGCDLMVYGDDEVFYERLKVRKITNITDEELSAGKNSGYRAIFIFDRKGSVKISDEQLLLIKKCCEDEGLDMFYIGKQYLADFYRLGFTAVDFKENELSLMYIGSDKVGQNVQQNEYGNMYAKHGLWMAEDEVYITENGQVGNTIFGLLYDTVVKAVEKSGVDQGK